MPLIGRQRFRLDKSNIQVYVVDLGRAWHWRCAVVISLDNLNIQVHVVDLGCAWYGRCTVAIIQVKFVRTIRVVLGRVLSGYVLSDIQC